MRIAGLTLAAMLVAAGMHWTAPTANAQAPAEATPFSDNYGALFYYKTTNEAFDIDVAAAQSREVQMAGPFDRPKIQAAEVERISVADRLAH